jgi:hypothetical protein
MTTPQLYVSKPTTVHASDPVTPDNREEVLAWVLAWGGHGKLTAPGMEALITIDNPMHGFLVVREGDRVMYNALLGGDFYPNAPETFDARWSPLPGDAEAGGAPVLGEPTGGT